MRKLSMNPLAGVCAKGLNICRILTLVVLAFSLGACSDDDEEVVVEFPQLQELACNVGETTNLSFKASADWQLTSSAVWCKFVADGEDVFAISGAAGEQNITLKADDEAYGHETSVANITLTMGLKKAVIAKVTRSAQGYELKVFNEEGKEVKEIEVGYGSFAHFTVEANFRFAATNRPSWVELEGGSMSGVADQKTVGGLRIIENGIVEKYPVAAADKQQLVFADEDGKTSFAFPLIFKGMNPREIGITGVTNNPWDWTVSLDGKIFTQESASGLTGESSKTVYKNRLPYTIKALNDEYEIVYMQKVEMMPGMFNYAIGADEGVDWMSFDKQTMSLSVNASVEEREGFVLAFPTAVYEEIKDDLWGNLIESTMDMETGMMSQELKYEYAENNLLLNFVQKDKKEEGGEVEGPNVKVTYMDMMQGGAMVEAPLTKCEEEGLIQDLGTENIYYVDRNLTSSFFIDPMLEGEWEYMAFLGDEDVTDLCEMMDGQLNIWIGDIEFPEGAEIQVIFKQNWMNERVVIIK